MRIRSILVPTDFSRHADKAFDTALEFARAFGASIELFHAYDFGQWVSLAEVTFAERAAEHVRVSAMRKLSPMIGRAKALGVQVSTHLAFGTPSQEVVKRARETSPDLIVMGTRGVGLVGNLVLGSVAQRTIQAARCPVLTVTAQDESDE